MKKNIFIVVLTLIVVSMVSFRFIDQQCPPMASVFADKMNVFYVGVDNPITVAGCGIPPELLDVNISGGGMVTALGNGRFNVKVTSGTQVDISVSERKDSVLYPLGKFSFRVKRIPDPVIYFGSSRIDDSLALSDIIAAPGIRPMLNNFDFDCAFTVVKYTATVIENGKLEDFKCLGPAISDDLKNRFAKMNAGARIEFRNVTVRGPDGSIRKIPGLSFIVK
ncbi:MAG TPA: GldM family protein [Bacteroidia bacterium]|nr:GldM family protein [Bacteroidia bacterium]